VHNQAPPLLGYDPLGCDPALVEAVRREGAGEALPSLRKLGALITSAEAAEHARLAETHPPVLHTHDRYGDRIDDVEFHPSWHWLLRTAVGWGLHGTPWVAEPGTGAHVARAAGFYLMAELESGHGCPISMTYAAVPALRREPELAAAFEPGLRACVYQPGAIDPAKKTGLLAGMSMTEAHAGSDLRAATTTATPSPDGSYRLVGHKWFTSAPTNDLFLTLAQAPGGLTCFVLPRVLPDGSRNAITLLRLKNKLGNRSNASAEIEYTGATGWRLGDEGRGVAAIIEMVSMTRLDCVLGSAALTRVALSEAAHHAAHRSAFGARLADAPLMQNVLADLALESEAATALGMRLAGAVDRGGARVAAAGPAGGQVPGVQAHPGGAGRGPGMPGRQRLCRGLGAAAAVPGGPVELDLGGVGQRHRARRAAGDHPRAGLGRGRARRAGRGRRGGRLVRPRGARAAHRAARAGGAAGAPDRRAARAVPAGQPAAARRPGRGGVGLRELAVPARRAVAHGGHAATRRPHRRPAGARHA
jgi:alkylation response protein AidB-like acyl-CoA dehydrogenase